MKEINAYLNFNGDCRQAMTFYSKCLGGELQLSTFGEGQPSMAEGQPEGTKDRILHARIIKGGTILLMASDTMPGMPFVQGTNFSISVQCESLPEIEGLFAAFSEGSEITMPLGDMFWGARFGMLKDRFGVHWMFSFELPK